MTTELHIENVSAGCDLVSLLTSLKCKYLDISSQSLGREETQALVQAMESDMEMVALWDEVTLDMEALAEYSGQGVCWNVTLDEDTADRYRGELVTWARSRNWRIYDDRDRSCIVQRLATDGTPLRIPIAGLSLMSQHCATCPESRV